MNFTGVKKRIFDHLPSIGQTSAVYGVIILLIYGWTIYWYLWKLPSWLFFMTVGELLTAFAYAMSVSLLESLLVLLVPVVVGLVLPIKWFRERFVSRGVILVVLLLVALMNYLNSITVLQDFPPGLFNKSMIALIVIILLVVLVGRIKFLNKLVEEIANRATIFAYVFLPISIISILVVLIRNIMSL